MSSSDSEREEKFEREPSKLLRLQPPFPCDSSGRRWSSLPFIFEAPAFERLHYDLPDLDLNPTRESVLPNQFVDSSSVTESTVANPLD